MHVSERQALRSTALSRTVVGKRVESVQSIHVRIEHVKRVRIPTQGRATGSRFPC